MTANGRWDLIRRLKFKSSHNSAQICNPHSHCAHRVSPAHQSEEILYLCLITINIQARHRNTYGITNVLSRAEREYWASLNTDKRGWLTRRRNGFYTEGMSWLKQTLRLITDCESIHFATRYIYIYFFFFFFFYGWTSSRTLQIFNL